MYCKKKMRFVKKIILKCIEKRKKEDGEEMETKREKQQKHPHKQ